MFVFNHILGMVQMMGLQAKLGRPGRQWLYGAWWPGHGVAGPRVGGLHEQLARICCHEVAWDMDFTLWIPLVI